jgi:hypothetical protein
MVVSVNAKALPEPSPVRLTLEFAPVDTKWDSANMGGGRSQVPVHSFFVFGLRNEPRYTWNNSTC